jgi:drug/metabolite transporter (DMT)-like permease
MMLLVAALGLIGNYVFYLLGVQHTSPGNAQLLIQLAPLLMALGGIFVFRESYKPAQWAGLGVIVLGLALFFREQLVHAASGHAYAAGSALVVVAAIVWALYALLQKQLLTRLDSPSIQAFIYVLAAIVLLPLAQPRELLALDARHAWLLAFCSINTLVAYGAFAEALAHWQASRVSAILAVTPLLTLATIAGLHALGAIGVAAEHVGTIGYAGALLVVAGSAMCSLLGNARAVPVAAGATAGGDQHERVRPCPVSRMCSRRPRASRRTRMSRRCCARARWTSSPARSCTSSARTCSAPAPSSSAAPATRCGRCPTPRPRAAWSRIPPATTARRWLWPRARAASPRTWWCRAARFRPSSPRSPPTARRCTNARRPWPRAKQWRRRCRPTPVHAWCILSPTRR